jgi:sporulation protein YlmC with PRC-barrel domain
MEALMLLSDLQGRRVRREDGEVLGRVFVVHATDGRVESLICGARGFLQRLSGSRAGHRVAWDDVVEVTGREIVVRGGGSRRAG